MKRLFIIGASLLQLPAIRRAKELLTYNDKTLAEISFILGFSSQSHFQNTFKKAFGITPMQYRKDSQKR